MRELLNEDMYLISEIIDKMDLQMPSLKKEGGAKKTRDELGADVVLAIVRKIYMAKGPINQLLANVMGKNLSEVEQMSLAETGSSLATLFGKKGIADFFR